MAAALPALAPDLGRTAAQEAARRELANPAYHRDDPSLVERALQAVSRLLEQLLETASDAAPGGYVGLLVLALVLAALALAIRLRIGAVGREVSEAAIFTGAPRSADDHRRAADAAAGRGDWDEAVRERFRAVVRGLEERALVEPRPGATATEVAAEAGAGLPAQAGALRAGARTFSEVRYGGRAGTPAAHAELRELDASLRSARPAAEVGAVSAGSAGGAGGTLTPP